MATDVIIPMLLFLSHVVVFVLGIAAGRYVALHSRIHGRIQSRNHG